MDNLTKEQRHRNMQQIRSRDTKPELILRHELWKLGVHYRKNYTKLPGKPDIVLTKYKIAIFCDGDFWHGKDINKIRGQVKTNRQYWIPKIERNIEHDQEVDAALLCQGWMVLRFWESDIIRNRQQCINTICKYIIFPTK